MYEAEKLMIKLGMPQNLMGFRYLVEAVDLDLNNMIVQKKMMHTCYECVAEKFGTTVSRVERAMRHAIDVVFFRGDLDTIKAVFGNSVNPMKGRATVSEFVRSCTSYIRRSGGIVDIDEARKQYIDKLLVSTFPEYAKIMKEAENND